MSRTEEPMGLAGVITCTAVNVAAVIHATSPIVNVFPMIGLSWSRAEQIEKL